MPVADEELRLSLERVLKRRVRTIARRQNAYCSSFAVEDIDLTFDEGGPLSLVFKDTAASALTAEAAGAKPAALLDPDRELEAYRVLGPAGLQVPACYGAVAEPRIGRHWLFLEAVDGVPLWQVSERDAWDGAARWLGELHGGGPPPRYRHLLRYDAAYFRRWIDRAVAFVADGSLAAVAAGWDRVVDRLTAWPPTLVHGEFYPSNLLVRRGAVVPVDWEMAGVGPGLLDVAALISGDWDAAERERLALVYLDSLPTARRPQPEVFLDALAYCRLHVAVQWLGWSQDWSPPAEHAHDWLAEAIALAGELGF
jgi:aminoglycoside phosphotransferase (APT) family kinase protein